MLVLAIESSFDETAAAVVRDKENGLVEVLLNVTASSVEVQTKYGGVVPEVAAREQVAAIIPVIKEAFANFTSEELPPMAGSPSEELRQIDAIAVAYGPGLIGSLLIGVETAKTLALVWNKPLIRVNHMAAHVFANWILPSTASDTVTQRHGDTPELPAVGLVVSGGHTDIILIKSLIDWRWLGGTRDDAAGEAYDKAARMMGLSFPGGPAIAKLAEQVSGSEFKVLRSELRLPRPMIHEDSLDLSFSGLKTALVQMMHKNKAKFENEPHLLHLLAREFDEAVTEVLVAKTMKAVELHNPRSVLLAGGVAANKLLRTNLELGIINYDRKIKFFVPELKYCTDNAAMIGACAILRPDYIDHVLLRPEPGLGVV